MPQALDQLRRVGDRRLATETAAHQCQRRALRRARQIWKSIRQRRRQILRNHLVVRDADDRFVQREYCIGGFTQSMRLLSFADHDYLGVGLRKMLAGYAVRSREESVLSGHAGENFHGLLRLIAIPGIVRIAVQAQQRNRSRRISRRRRRVLKRLAPRREHAQHFAFDIPFGVEKSSRSLIEEFFDHGIDDRFSEFEVREIRRCLVRIQAGQGCESIIIEQAAHLALGRHGVGVGEHVQQTLLGTPSLGQHAIERAQRELPRFLPI